MFDQLPPPVDDPILGLFEAYQADPRPAKVNLGIGIYCDDTGRVPQLGAVRAARASLAQAGAPSVYPPCSTWCSARPAGPQPRPSPWCRRWPAPGR